MEVPVGVKCYTEYYRNNKDNPEYIEKVSANYKKYDKKHLLLRAMLYIMLAFLVIYNFFEAFSQVYTQENTLHRIGYTIISFFSVFYIYNYCDLIMRARSRCASIIVAAVGFIINIFSYLQPLWWVITFGAEILFLGISIGLALCRGTVSKASENLKKDAIMFSGIGGTILFLGMVFYLYFSTTLDYTWQYVLLRASYYLLYTVYAGMSSYNHIKSDYIMNKIGYIGHLSKSEPPRFGQRQVFCYDTPFRCGFTVA